MAAGSSIPVLHQSSKPADKPAESFVFRGAEGLGAESCKRQRVDQEGTEAPV